MAKFIDSLSRIAGYSFFAGLAIGGFLNFFT